MIDLPPDIERCSGIGSVEDGWFEDCETCLRRLSEPSGKVMKPPAIIAFFCEYSIPMDFQAQQLKSRRSISSENAYKTNSTVRP
jgi:hypothetical protein